MTDPQVKVVLSADTRRYVTQMRGAAQETSKVDRAQDDMRRTAARNAVAWAGVGTAATLAGRKALQGLHGATEAASALNESASKMRTIFGDSARDIEDFGADSAQALGMSTRAAYDAASQMAVFGKSAGLAGDDLTEFSTDMVQLAADFASFFDTSPEDAVTAIGAALRGESEPIRRYGVLLDDATLKQRAFEMGLISTTKDALTPQTKALAAQKEILAQAGDAAGDYARTAGDAANSQRTATAEFENARAALGEALLPLLADGAKAAARLAEAFADLPGPARAAAAGLGLIAAGTLTLAPSIVATAKGVKALRTALASYRTVAVSTAAANEALALSQSSVAATSGGRLGKLLPAAAGAATVGATVATAGVAAVAVGALAQRARVQNLSEEQVQRNAGTTQRDALQSAALTNSGPIFMQQQAAAASAASSALRSHATAADSSAQASGKAAKSAEELAAAEDELNKAAEEATAAMFESINVRLALSGASDAVRGAEGRLAEAVEEHGASLKRRTAAGRENREAMRSEIEVILAHSQAVIDNALANGDDAVTAYEKGRRALEKNKEALIRAAEKAGYAKGEVKDFVNELATIPKTKATTVEFRSGGAQSALDHWKRQLDGIPSSKTTHIKTRFDRYNDPDGFATGGRITGPGTGTSDSVPIMASNGEWLTRASSAQKYGDDFMAAVNAGTLSAANVGSYFPGVRAPGGGESAGGFHIGTINVQEASASGVRVNVLDALSEAAYRSGAVR